MKLKTSDMFKPLPILACLGFVTCAHAAPGTEISYELIQASPKTTNPIITASIGHDAVAHPSRFLRRLQANSQETILVSGTLPLRHGHAEIRQLKPVIIQSTSPNIHIGPTHDMTGLALTVQEQPVERKMLLSAQMRYTWHVGDNHVEQHGHSVTFPILRTVLFTTSRLSALGHKQVEYMSNGQKYFIFVLQAYS